MGGHKSTCHEHEDSLNMFCDGICSSNVCVHNMVDVSFAIIVPNGFRNISPFIGYHPGLHATYSRNNLSEIIVIVQ